MPDGKTARKVEADLFEAPDLQEDKMLTKLEITLLVEDPIRNKKTVS